MTLSHNLRALNAMKILGLFMTCTTLGRELRAVDYINDSRTHELRALNSMSNLKF